MKRLLIVLSIVLMSAIAITVVAALLIQQMFAGILQNYVRNELGWTLKIGSAQIQFQPLSVRLDNIEISAPNQKPFLNARSVEAEVPYNSFWSDEFIVRNVTIESPRFNINQFPKLTPKSQPSEKSKEFRIEDVRVGDAEVSIEEYNFEAIELKAKLDSRGLDLQSLKSRFKTSELSAHGTVTAWSKPNFNFEYSMHGEAADFVSAVPEIGDLKGPIDVKGSIRGEVPELILVGNLEQSALTLNGSKPFLIEARYQYRTKDEKPLQIEAEWKDAPSALVKNYWKEMPPVSAMTNGVLRYSGNQDLWAGDGNILIQFSKIPCESRRGCLPVSGRIQSSLRGGVIQIEHTNLSLPSSTVTATGYVKKESLGLNVYLSTSHLGDFASLQPELNSIPGNFRVEGEISGPYNDITIQGKFTGQKGQSSVQGSGKTALRNRSLAFNVDGRVIASDFQKLLPQLQEGDFQFEGSIDGTFKNPRVHASFNGKGIKARDLQIDTVSARVDTREKTLEFHGEIPGLFLTADGTYRMDNGAYQIQGRTEGATAENFTALFAKETIPLSGPIHASFEASGNAKRWKQSSAHIQIDPSDFEWKEEPLHVATMDARVQNGDAQLMFEGASSNSHLRVDGSVSLLQDHKMDFQVQGTINTAMMQKLTNDWKGTGELNLNASIRGTTDHPAFEGEIASENLNLTYLPKNMEIQFDSVKAALAGKTIDLLGSGTFSGSKFSFHGSLPVERERGNLHVEVGQLQVKPLLPDSNVTGQLDIAADFSGEGFPLLDLKPGEKINIPFHEWSGTISVTPSDLKLGENALSVNGPLVITADSQVIKIAPLQISSGELLESQASGSLNLKTGEIESTVHVAAKIDLLSSIKADIQSSGPLTLDLAVGGTIDEPAYQGNIQITQASLRIPNSPLFLENLDLQASIDKKGLYIKYLQARSGGGTIQGGGELIPHSDRSYLWFRGKNVATNYPEGLRSQVDFDLKLNSKDSNILLSGDVSVLRSLYEQNITYRNPILRQLLASTPDLSREKQLKNRLKFDLNIKTVKDLRIDNYQLNLLAGGNLKLEGSLYRPRLTGRVSIREGGRFFLAGNQYDIEQAKLDFFGSELIEPELDVTLSTLLRDFNTDTFYEVFIPFGGSLSNIEFKNVRANPSLSEDQIFSLLTEGTVESEQIASYSDVFQRQLVAFLAGQAFVTPASTVARTIGLSRIQVQQEGLSSVNDPKTRLVLGKDLGQNFSLIYSFPLDDPQDQTWIASYRYGRNIVGRFIDQDDGTYTASVSHRVQFGKGAPVGGALAGSRKKDRGPRVSSIQISNETPLTEEQIQDKLNISAGDFYDYWDFQDRVDELKKELQKLGYLMPSVEIQENEDEKGHEISLQVNVRSGDRAEMIFNGFEISDKLRSRYDELWRNGISSYVIQQLIQEDLVRQLQISGYHKAVVRSSTEGNQFRFDIQPGTRFTSIELQFSGTNNYDPSSLQRDLMQLYPSPAQMFTDSLHNFSTFRDRMKALYIKKGYLRVEITPGPVLFPEKSGSIVRHVSVNEGVVSKIASLTVSEGQSFPSDLQSKLLLNDGKIFDPDAILEDELTIHGFYEAEGYPDVRAKQNLEFQKDSSDLLIRWDLQTGQITKIASIRISGNQTTRTDLIMKQSGLKEGEVLTRHSRSTARKRLSDLGVFQQVNLDTEKTDTPGMYDVLIQVTESKKYEFQYGGRYNTDDQLGVETRLTDFNFLGRAHNVSLYVRSSLDLPLFRLDYTLPVTQSIWDRTRFSLFRDDRDDDVEARVDGDIKRLPFNVKQLTFQFQQERRFTRAYRLIWGFEFSSFSATFTNFETNIIDTLEGTSAVFRGAFVGDTRDDPLNAQGGHFYSVDGKFAPTILGSDISYAKNFSQFFYYRKLGKVTSVTGARAGFLKIRSNFLTIAEKFRTGGSTTVRGFELNTVVPGNDPLSVFFGGDSVFIFNQELRFPVYKWISGAIFYDGGNVYRLATDFDPLDLRHSAGFGFRAGTGGFLLRFDFGFNLNPEDNESQTVFHFGIGQAF